MTRFLALIAAILVARAPRDRLASPQPTGARSGRRRLYAQASALDGFFVRTNDGLAAVAFVLAVVLTVTSVVRHPESFLPQPGVDSVTVMLLGP